MPPSKLALVYARADESRKDKAAAHAISLQIYAKVPRKHLQTAVVLFGKPRKRTRFANPFSKPCKACAQPRRPMPSAGIFGPM
jgi:hypothetical protein